MSKYSFAQFIDVLSTISNISRHLKFHTLSFTSDRAQVHQKMIDEIIRTAQAPTSKRPKAYIVIGGAGSGKTRVANELQKQSPFISIDSNVLKEQLITKEQKLDQTISKKQWSDWLQREAEFLRQELFYQSVQAKKDLIFESVGTDSGSIQANIDALLESGYEIELHLADTSEAIAVDRTATRNQETECQVPLSHVKKSNRKAKTTYRELSELYYDKIKLHRWSNNGDEPEMDDQRQINQCFEQLILGLSEERLEILSKISSNEPIDEHITHISELTKLSANSRDPHSMLFTLINDIALFPELYVGREKELALLYPLLDRSTFHVYFASMQLNGPLKSHGGVAIASPILKQGISFAAAGDPRRSQIDLPKDFKSKIISEISSLDKIPETITQQMGSQTEILEILNSDKPLDTYCLHRLIVYCTPDLLTEFNNIKARYISDVELWDKPRSVLQKRDNDLFNKHYPTYLAEKNFSKLWRGIGHIFHALTRRQLALREQTHVASSTVLSRWIEVAKHRMKIDKERCLTHNEQNVLWRFSTTASGNKGGNCNSISTYLLGVNPETASIFNIGTSKGLKLIVPKPPSPPTAREPRSGNRYSDMLWETHMAKLIVHNPQSYQQTILKVNKKIIDSLAKIQDDSKNLLTIEIHNVYAEFDVLKDNPIDFLTAKLTSTDPKDIYRSLLFHKPYFENIANRSISEYLRDRYAFYSMRPSSMFATSAPDSRPLYYHNGVGCMRLHEVGPLHVHDDSFNGSYATPPAASENLFPNDSFKAQDNVLFCSGTSSTMTTMLPYIFHSILIDDPLAQEDYIMAWAGANAYAGHHSIHESLTPLKYMHSVCPEHLMSLGNKTENLYDQVLTERFKRFIHHKPVESSLTRYDQCVKDFNADKQRMNQYLQTHPGLTCHLVKDVNKEQEKIKLMVIIENKIKQLYKQRRSFKLIFLKGLHEKLGMLDVDNPQHLDDLYNHLHHAENFNVNQFQGLFGYSRFKSQNGQSITESQWIIEQTQLFLGLMQTQTASKESKLSPN